MLPGKEECGGQSGETGADDDHVDIGVADERTVVFRRFPGGSDPVGGRIVHPETGTGRDKRIVKRIVWRGFGATIQREGFNRTHGRLPDGNEPILPRTFSGD